MSKDSNEEHLPPETEASPLVAVIMGSKSDWETMQHADEVLTQFGVPHECSVVSAHRTPAWMAEFAREAEGRGLEVIIAGAGGAAHLPGMVAAQTLVPVLGVPVRSKSLNVIEIFAPNRNDRYARRNCRDETDHARRYDRRTWKRAVGSHVRNGCP